MPKIHLSVYMTVLFLLLCSISWVQSEAMRSRAAVRAANERDDYVDKLFLETSDQEKQKHQPLETWNLPDAKEEKKAYGGGSKGSDADIIDGLNDELEVETYDYMKADAEWDSDDDLNDGRDNEW